MYFYWADNLEATCASSPSSPLTREDASKARSLIPEESSAPPHTLDSSHLHPPKTLSLFSPSPHWCVQVLLQLTCEQQGGPECGHCLYEKKGGSRGMLLCIMGEPARRPAAGVSHEQFCWQNKCQCVYPSVIFPDVSQRLGLIVWWCEVTFVRSWLGSRPKETLRSPYFNFITGGVIM